MTPAPRLWKSGVLFGHVLMNLSVVLSCTVVFHRRSPHFVDHVLLQANFLCMQVEIRCLRRSVLRIDLHSRLKVKVHKNAEIAHYLQVFIHCKVVI